MSTGTSNNHATLRYTGMRLGIFAACFAVVWFLAFVEVIEVSGADGMVLLIGVAAVVSAPLSYILLNRQRDAMSEQIVDKVADTRRRLAANRSGEDDVDDAMRLHKTT